ncbi:MAG: hypothetical protein ACKOYN_04590 [Planctomycetota bacterium]
MRPALAAVISSLAALLAAPSHAVTGDECSDPLIAVVGANPAVDTGTMTPSADPPANLGCIFLSWNGSKDAWWRFAAPASGKMSISLCGSNFDTSLVVYQGNCGSLTRIACDDDSCNPSAGYQSKIDNLSVQAGYVYIRVGGYNAATGSAVLNLSFTIAPDLGAAAVRGVNDFGQAAVPTYLGYIKSLDIAATGYHCVALRDDGTVWAWGNNIEAQCVVPSTLNSVVAVAASSFSSMALRSDGTIVSWGNSWTNPPAGLTGVVQIDAGRAHAIARKSDGTVQCWGWNSAGQSTVPAGLTGCAFVSAAEEYSLAIRGDGTAVSWGAAPTHPAGLTGLTKAAAGASHVVAVKSDGTVVCWGFNGTGQCSVPPGLTGVVAVAAGSGHSVALKSDGSLVQWGSNGGTQRDFAPGAAPYTVVAAGFEFTATVSRGDCDANGTIDGAEVPWHDCNGNGFHDCWDFQLGNGEDCNGNGLGDECEKQITVSVASGALSPIGFGSPKTYAILNAVPAVEPVRLRVRAKGDFSGALESVRLTCGTMFAREVLAGSADCVTLPWTVITLTADEFNDGIGADGTWRLDMTPSSAVNPALCPGGSWIEADLLYAGARPADCDANGVLDSCQIAAGQVPDVNGNGVPDSCESLIDSCPTDLNNDGQTGAADLALILGAWGGTNPEYDLNADGLIGAADLALLLGAWGACPSN